MHYRIINAQTAILWIEMDDRFSKIKAKAKGKTKGKTKAKGKIDARGSCIHLDNKSYDIVVVESRAWITNITI